MAILGLSYSTEEWNAALWKNMIHDIGKIGIDDGILNKPGKLSEAEWKVMLQHNEYKYNPKTMLKLTYIQQRKTINNEICKN